MFAGNSEQWLECVLNYSEGRRPAVIAALEDVVRGFQGVYVLGSSPDPDHNRTVLTFVSQQDAIADAAFAVVAEAERLIDIRNHDGVHPRIGAVDVIPFVALGQTPAERALEAARGLAKRLGEEFQLPVFLYGRAAAREERSDLSSIRKGGLEGLRHRLSDPFWTPDFGPPVLHATLGAVAVGAREILIAYNVFLETADLALARRIARSIRQSSGGLKSVKALGLYLESRGQAQISINLTDYTTTGLEDVFRAICQEAEMEGVAISSSEIIGFAPKAAVRDPHFLRLENRDPFILEERIRAVSAGEAKE